MAKKRILVLGGLGRVGLPLVTALAEAHPGYRFYLEDRCRELQVRVAKGEFPYRETGATRVFRRLMSRQIFLGSSGVPSFELLLITFDLFKLEKSRPILRTSLLKELHPFLSRSQRLIVTSTLPVGGFAVLKEYFASHYPSYAIAYCPIRCAEGKVYREMKLLPQLAAVSDPRIMDEVRRLFSPPAPVLMFLTGEECELAKLLTNYYRYSHFALANELFLISERLGVDYKRVFSAMTLAYPRLKTLPLPGFSAGPCLPKDTEILSRSLPFESIGERALHINREKFLEVITEKVSSLLPPPATVGLLGAAFKSQSDDRRGSLTDPLKDRLEARGYRVLVTDEYLSSPDLVALEELLQEADLYIVMVPHNRYKNLSPRKPLIDPWGVRFFSLPSYAEP